jgi:hypothetical protein
MKVPQRFALEKVEGIIANKIILYIFSFYQSKIDMAVKATIFIVAIIVISIISVTQQITFAQIPGILGSDNNPDENTASESATNNTASSDFVTYQNEKFGYTLQYPGDWSVSEFARLDSVVITSPDKQAAFSVDILKPQKFLDTNNMQVKTKTPHDLVVERINYMRQQNPQAAALEYDSYLRDKSVTIANNQAWQLEYTAVTSLNFAGTNQFYKTDYYIPMPSNDGTVMRITFTVGQLDAPKYLPIAQQVIRSIQLA